MCSAVAEIRALACFLSIPVILLVFSALLIIQYKFLYFGSPFSVCCRDLTDIRFFVTNAISLITPSSTFYYTFSVFVYKSVLYIGPEKGFTA